MHSKKSVLALVALVAGVLGSTGGCAGERDAINQVQPNALSKHFFVGDSLADRSDDPEFYMRNTVVDVPYGAALDGLFTATYAQPLARIKWEISENALIARQTHEHIENSDHKGSRVTNDGQVVAMFQIESHFDIRRAYNPSTGEEFNVIVENVSDRPWYMREYMRVNWSRNMVTDGYEVDTLSMLGMFGGLHWDPMNYELSDPNDPNAPLFATEEGYFDVTTKAFASPTLIDTPWGRFPGCWFDGDWTVGEGTGSFPYGNCNPTEVTLRLAFRRVIDTDFEASDWAGTEMEAFGWFLQERFGYERNYGVVDQRWHRFASKYNFWEKSHIEGAQCAVDYWRDKDGKIAKYQVAGGKFATDPQTGLPIPDVNGQPYPGTPVGQDTHRLDTKDPTTEAECAFRNSAGEVVNPGSRCDEFAQKCTIPFRDRKTRAIPWYYGPDSDPTLFAATREATDQWNIAGKRAVLLAQKADAERVGLPSTVPTTNEEDLKLRKNGGETVPDIFILCHNPVMEGDNVACGKPGLRARVGDLRYNMVNIIPDPQTPSPWGIMVDADDPLTGEKIVTSVNEWGHVLDLAVQGTVDLIRYVNGEISPKDITNGKYMVDWINASKAGTKQFKPTTLSQGEIQNRLGSLDTRLAKYNGLTAKDANLPKQVQRQVAANNLSKTLGPSVDNKLETIRNQQILSGKETDLITGNQLTTVGLPPDTMFAGNDQVIAAASPLRGLNPQLSRWIHRQRDITLAQRASCMIEQPEPDALVGLARMTNKLYPLPDSNDPNFPAKLVARNKAIHDWLREQFHISVIAHEMGHSMGLRHNFTSSYDALNYFTEYWQLRTRNGAEKTCPDATTPHTDGKDCVGPRWVDPVTEEETNGLIWKWGSTTVMDYPGDITQDMNGLGAYDKAAMRFVYGDLVDVDKDAHWHDAAKGDDYISVLDGFGGISGYMVGDVHYSSYQQYYKPLGNCTTQADPNNALSAKCSGFNLDYVPRRDMKTVPKYGNPAVLDVRPDLVSNFAVDPQNRVRHPYMFGSDEYADTGNIPVFRFDAGADSYEQISFITAVYENRYIFDNFRRNRITFNSRAVMDRVQSRYFDKMQGITKSLGLLIQLYYNPDTAIRDPGVLMPAALGSADSLATMIRVLTRPDPGAFQVGLPVDTGLSLRIATPEDINGQINNPLGDFKVAAGSGEGRFIHNDYDYTQGYFWSSYQTQAGTWYEKKRVMNILLEGYNHFVSNSREDYIDGRYKNINYATLFPEQIRRIVAQIMQNDPTTLGPYVIHPTTAIPGDYQPKTVSYLRWELYDTSDPKTIALDYPADAVVLEPDIGWEQQQAILYDAWWYGATVLTMDMPSQLRVWTPDGVDAVTTAIPLSDQIRFRDPVTGIIYAARNYGTEVVNSAHPPVQKTAGARMIQFANELVKAVYPSAGTVTDKDGFVYPNYDAKNPIDSVKAQKLKGYVATLDYARRMAKDFGQFLNDDEWHLPIDP